MLSSPGEPRTPRTGSSGPLALSPPRCSGTAAGSSPARCSLIQRSATRSLKSNSNSSVFLCVFLLFFFFFLKRLSSTGTPPPPQGIHPPVNPSIDAWIQRKRTRRRHGCGQLCSLGIPKIYTVPEYTDIHIYTRSQNPKRRWEAGTEEKRGLGWGSWGDSPGLDAGLRAPPPPKTPGLGTRQTRAPSAATAGISVGGAPSRHPPRLLWGKSQGLAGTPPPANHDGKGLFRGGSRLAAAAPFVCSCWRGGVKEAQEGLGVALPPPRRGRDVGQQLQPRRGLAAEFSFPRVAPSAVQQSTWRGTFPSVAKRGKKKPKKPTDTDPAGAGHAWLSAGPPPAEALAARFSAGASSARAGWSRGAGSPC